MNPFLTLHHQFTSDVHYFSEFEHESSFIVCKPKSSPKTHFRAKNLRYQILCHFENGLFVKGRALRKFKVKDPLEPKQLS